MRVYFEHRLEDRWSLSGYSLPANRAVDFEVDLLYGGRIINGEKRPNIRERLVCPVTQLNNRQRLIAGLLLTQRFSSAYFMEQVTPIFTFAKGTLSADITGSEFLGNELRPGEIRNGIQHEDIQNLSFANSSFDLIVSNDVMEHVPSPRQAFSECARILQPGGQMLMAVPVHDGNDRSVVRAEMAEDGTIRHHLPPEYHGNPLSPDGSLVFTDYGWDLFKLVRLCGFRDITMEITTQSV